MTNEIFDAASAQGALWAVVLGAILATLGGFAATQLESFVEHRRRERNAALFFGELLFTLQVILHFVNDTHGRGDPFGPITIRMLKSARKEIDIFDRNRESVFDLRDADLRARLQTLIIRMTMPIEGVFEATNEVNEMLAQLKGATESEMRAELEERIADVRGQRDRGYDFIMEVAGELPQVVRDLEPLARHSFRNFDDVVKNF